VLSERRALCFDERVRRLLALLLGGFAVIDCSLVGLDGYSDGSAAQPPAADSGSTPTTEGGTTPVSAEAGTFGPASVVASGEADPRGIVADADGVFWVNSGGGSVRALLRGETTPRSIATDLGQLLDIQLDGSALVVHRPGADHCSSQALVLRMAKDGSNRRTLFGHCRRAPRFAVDATSIVTATTTESTTGRQSQIQQVPKEVGVTLETVDSPNYPGAVAADGINVYWVRENVRTIVTAPKGQTTAPLLFATSPAKPIDLVVDGDALAWITEGGDVFRLLRRSPGATPEALATGQPSPSRILADPTGLYWTNTGDGSVQWLPRDSATVVPIATGIGQPYGVARNDEAVWATTREGTIVRIAAR
jgi:hypothetical protein